MASISVNRVTPADANDLIRANIESRDYHRPWAYPFTNISGFDSWFARTLAGPNVSLIAREAASGDVVGVVNLNEIVAGALRSAYLGYYGMVRWAGQGLMTEAVRVTVAYAFGDLGLHRVEANIQPGNAASIGLVQRLGFRKEGFSPRYLFIDGAWRDHERWARLADDAP